MKRVVFFLLFVFSIWSGYTQEPGSIIGKWLKTPNEDLIIEVYKSQDEYKGKVSWVKDTSMNKQLGLQILEGLKYDAKRKIWSNGKVRNPKSGNAYSASVKIKADGMLEVLAYKGMKFIGRKKYFKRVK